MPHCLELHMNLYLCSDLVCKLSSKDHFSTTDLLLGRLILYSLECTTLTFFLLFFLGWGGDLHFSWASCRSGYSWESDSNWTPPSVDSWAFSCHFCSLLFMHASRGVKVTWKWFTEVNMGWRWAFFCESCSIPEDAAP